MAPLGILVGNKSALALLWLSLAGFITSSTPTAVANSSFSNSETSLTFLYQNNLNASDDVNHAGAILLDPATQDVGAAQCSSLSETLLPISTLQNHTDDFQNILAYLAYSGVAQANQEYYIDNGVLSVTTAQGASLGFSWTSQQNMQGGNDSNVERARRLPILCSQSSTANGATNAVASASNEVRVPAAGNLTYVGFRNQKSFRFVGIPYANALSQRWTYATVFNRTDETIDATRYGPDCAQAGDAGSSEDCLYLNIQTPYLPRSSQGLLAGSLAPTTAPERRLRPVMFSIHGGGFTGGNGGASSGLDGGNMASREDIVSVQLNYRLSTLGFLAVPGTDIKGNYGIGDQITALKWVKKNIASFGGDPNNVVIIGESAGAGSVRTLLGSPPVIQDDLIAGGVAMSNLGGGKALGLVAGDYATTYSSYYTINDSFAVAGPQILDAAGCANQTTTTELDAQIACLRQVPAADLVSLATVARYVVQDGTLVNTAQLVVSERNGSAAYVPVIFGTTENDGASFCGWPSTTTTNTTSSDDDDDDEVEGLAVSLGISTAAAQRVVDSGLFPRYDTGNRTLDTFNVSQRVSTDLQFRCVDEATVYAAAVVAHVFPRAYYYTIDRTYEGYDPLGLGPALTGGGGGNGSAAAADPNYFRLHGSDLGFTYGNQAPLRDERDLQASQLVSGYYAAFVRSGQPNPDEAYLTARGYDSTLRAVRQTGSWEPVRSGTGPTKKLDYPSPTVDFPDLAQCAFLNYSLNYYLEGGS